MAAAGRRLAAVRRPALLQLADWCAASDSGADLLWRVKDDLRLPYLELLPDGSYRSVLVKTAQPGSRRGALIEAAAGRTWTPPWPGTSA